MTPTTAIKEQLSETAILSAEMIVSWKKKRGVYNFESLPGKAIIALSRDVFPKRFHFPFKKLRGIGGTNFIDGEYLCCSGFGSGAPALITLMEEIRALGVTEFIFIGLCGALTEDIVSATAFYVNKAWSANGVARTYFLSEEISPFNAAYVQKFANALGLDAATCFSTDSPFRETASLLELVRLKDCNLIEMECAAAYAFSHFYQLNVVCMLIAADQLTTAWQPPSDMDRIVSVQKKLINTIIKHSL